MLISAIEQSDSVTHPYYCCCCLVAKPLQPRGLWPARLLRPWYFPGKSTVVGCHFLLQGIFPTQRSDQQLLRLLHWQVDSLPLSPPARPLPTVMTASSTIVKWPFTRTQGQVHLSYGSRIQSHRWMRICVTMPFVVEDIKRTEKILSSPFVGPVITPTYSHKSVLSL